MADQKKSVPENVAGDFFVDSTCINCDACRQLAPETFIDAGATSCVKTQPVTIDQKRKALQALLACPTSSIGTRNKNRAEEVILDFPIKIDAEVFYCGFNSAKSYGASRCRYSWTLALNGFCQVTDGAFIWIKRRCTSSCLLW